MVSKPGAEKGGKEGMSIEPRLDHLVELAREGNEEALEAVVRAIQDRIYNLALRMLWRPSHHQRNGSPKARLASATSEVYGTELSFGQ